MDQEQHKEIILSLSKKNGDFIVQTYRSSGPGGQNVNKRDTAVRIIHPASGAVGESQTHRKQFENRREAFRRLAASSKFKTWLKTELTRQGFLNSIERQEGPTGSRGERVRTYNAVRDEVVDHRIGLHVKGMQDVLDGNLEPIVTKLEEERIRCLLSNEHDSEEQ